MLTVAIKGLKALENNLRKDIAAEKKALDVAVKKEAFVLSDTMKTEIRKGAPGGRPYTTLKKTVISRAKSLSKGTRAGNQTALSSLAKYVRVRYSAGVGHEIAVGFKGKGRGAAAPLQIISRHQEGYTVPVSKKTRRYFAGIAHEYLPKRSRLKRYFHIRKSTTAFHVPGRPIIDPFWRAHKTQAWRKIREKYRRKLRGERI